ncbi:ketopantoate reductase family protein [Oscillibacter sp.]|uniref:ketopantoate reductase family protein n=1 Tax=Oscillibacter sp. TaxID=1945593 RepID=UPI002D7E7222|nr:ketopantoate reductase C-terminal domain-containing protein [Oscillibacter sp.]
MLEFQNVSYQYPSEDFDIIDHLNPAGMPSLRQDVLARRPTEVELFSGTINRLGAAHGIPTPQNERFYAAIKELESSFS